MILNNLAITAQKFIKKLKIDGVINCQIIAKLFGIISCKFSLNRLRFSYFIMKRKGLQIPWIHFRNVLPRASIHPPKAMKLTFAYFCSVFPLPSRSSFTSPSPGRLWDRKDRRKLSQRAPPPKIWEHSIHTNLCSRNWL